MRDGHLLKRAGREFAKNLIWLAVVFGSLGVLWSGADNQPRFGGHDYPGSPPDHGADNRGGDWPVGGWDGGGGGDGGGWGG